MDKSEREDFAATLAIELGNAFSKLDVNNRTVAGAQATRNEALVGQLVDATRYAALAAWGAVVVAVIGTAVQLYT